MNTRRQLVVILTISVVALVAVASLPPIAQAPGYHQFADTQRLFGIPYFWNLATSGGFILVGMTGCVLLAMQRQCWSGRWRAILWLYFVGVFLTGIGSGYYHLNPNNQTLVFDRLPMSIAFAAFFCLVLGITVSPRAATRMLPVLLIVGPASVIYWYLSELRGAGDLRPYALVQFLPLLLIPVMLITSDHRPPVHRDIWWVLAAYVLAKLFELNDRLIADWTGVIGGHPIKHLVAAGGAAFVLRAMYRPGIARARGYRSPPCGTHRRRTCRNTHSA